MRRWPECNVQVRFERVVAPAHLVQWTIDELAAALGQYVSGEPFRMDVDVQPTLPLSLRRVRPLEITRTAGKPVLFHFGHRDRLGL